VWNWAFLHVKQTEGVYVPRGEDFLELRLGVWFPVLAAFELHSLFGESQFLLLLAQTTDRYHPIHTSLEKYQAFDISGTSGRTKNPAMAIGNEITPSMMNSLHQSSAT
jgi:hypothetical protein